MKNIRFFVYDHEKKVANSSFSGKIVLKLPFNAFPDERSKAVRLHNLHQWAEGNNLDQQLRFILLPVMQRHPEGFVSDSFRTLGQIGKLQHGTLQGIPLIGDFKRDRFICQLRNGKIAEK